ncbi:MAG: TolC family protein [Bacteroidota bacterium]
MQLKRLLAAIILLPAASFGQEIWSLEKCIQYAKDNNIQIKQSELQIDMNDRLRTQAAARFLPTVNAQGSNTYNYGRTIDPFTNTFANNKVRSTQLFLSGNLNLFSGFQNWNQLAQSHYEYLASIKDTEQRSNDVSLSIATAYLQILFGKELVKNAENQLEISRLQRDRISKLVVAGSLAESNQFDIDAQYARDELALVNAENSLNLYYLQLYQYLQLDINTEIEVQTPDNLNVDGALLSANADDVYHAAVGIMPEVKAQELRMQSAEKALNVAMGAIVPRLALSGSYGSGYSGNNVVPLGTPTTVYTPIPFYDAQGNAQPATVYSQQQIYTEGFAPKKFNDQLKDNLNKSISVTLTVPIFNGLTTNTSIKRARVNSMNARLQYEAVRNTLQQTVQRSYNDALSAYKQFLASEKLVSAQKESFKYADIKYQQNLINLVEYTDAKIKLTNAENDLVRSKYDYVFKTKVLDFYQGKGLSLK